MNKKYIRPYEFFLKNERELQNRMTFKNSQKHKKTLLSSNLSSSIIFETKMNYHKKNRLNFFFKFCFKYQPVSVVHGI